MGNSNQSTTNAEAITEFKLSIQDLTAHLCDVTKLKHNPGSPFVDLEWCGMMCTGKYIGTSFKPEPIISLQFEAQSCSAMLKRILRGAQKELQLLRGIKHENIITLFGVHYQNGLENTLPLVVTESIHCDLHQYLITNKFSCDDEVLNMLQGISSSIVYLHEVKHIIHNNITTTSIVVTKNLVAKLSCFESAKKLHQSENEAYSNATIDTGSFGEVMLHILSSQHCDANISFSKDLEQSICHLAAQCKDQNLACRPSACQVLESIKQERRMSQQKATPTTAEILLDKVKRLAQQNDALKQQNESLRRKIQEREEEDFQLTNAFTTADSRSPLKLGEEYKRMQHHDRLAANRAHKKAYGYTSPVPFQQHTMVAYEQAKQLVFTAFTQYIDQSLFQLKTQSDHTEHDKVLDSMKLVLNKLHEDHRLKEMSIENIRRVLSGAYESHVNAKDVAIPDPVKQYYAKLASFTWSSVTKAIPLVLSTEANTFDSMIHEINDDDLDDEVDLSTANVAYVYPTLFTSNNWPRELAIKGKVEIL